MPHSNDSDIDTTAIDTDETDPARVVATSTSTDAGDGSQGTVSVHTPYRRVVARAPDDTDLPFDGVDVDVSVSHRASGAPTWSVTAFGLNDWVGQRLNRGTSVKITAGWRDGPTRTIAHGPIQVVRPKPRDGTTAYTLRGTTHAGARLGKRLSRTWRDVAPHQIARDIADIANLSVGHIATTTERLDEHWTCTTSRPLSHWLDELTQDAARETNQEWTWYVHGDALYFVPRGTPTGARMQIRHRNAPSQFPARTNRGSPSDRDAHDRRFDQQLDPAVRRGRAVGIAPPGSGVAGGGDYGSAETETTYVIGAYQFETSSRRGHHYMHGTLVPTTAEFPPSFPESDMDDDVAPEESDSR